MKGIILAGGHGTRLHPATVSVSKQLLPVFDKPMIYYPLTTLMLGGIKDIALISTRGDIDKYRNLLKDGRQWGINIEYFIQEEPLGLAHAFLVCEYYIQNQSCCLILGDNIFHGNLRIKEIVKNFSNGALVFGYPVRDPQRYGVVKFDNEGRVLDIVEKPDNPPSQYAVPGLYLYDSSVVKRVKEMKPSDRGELEITDLNKSYLNDFLLQLRILGRGIAWFDTGTPISLTKASSFISLVEEIQSYKVGCPEEVAIREGFIDLTKFDTLLSKYPDNEYKEYLTSIRKEFDDTDFIKHLAIEDLQP